MRFTTYPERQRNRRLVRALESAGGAAIALLLAGLGLIVGWNAVSLMLLSCSLALGWRSRRWLQLAKRSAVGARSEQKVRAVLQDLEREGWTVRNSLRWPHGGDVDHVAIAPGEGLAFAIETKTRSYRPSDLARITAIADWLARRRARWCPQGAAPVLCLAARRGIESWQGGVAVVSADRLASVLSRLAGTTPKPRFLR
jgi:Holliday junction resolvase